MKTTFTFENPCTPKSDALIIPCISNVKNPLLDDVLKTFPTLADRVKRKQFKGQKLSLLSLETESNIDICLIGLGKSPTISDVRTAGAQIVSFLNKNKLTTASVFVTENAFEHLGYILEGAILGKYSFTRHKTNPRTSLIKHLKFGVFNNPIKKSVGSDFIKQKTAAVTAVTFCRDLVNEPTNHLGITEFINAAKSACKPETLSCRVLNETTLKKKKMGLLLGVGQGASTPPALLQITYTPKSKSKKHIALIGKGVVFDSGGLCLKPSASIAEMKTDMAGAAVVLSCMSALPALKIKTQVTAYIPLAENAIGKDAVRPGDVLTSFSGKTVEITNTDAEGRLILADALSLAKNNSFTETVTFATLTGACSVALGKKRGAVFSNDISRITKWLKVAQHTDEYIWHLPLARELETELKSDVADLKNSGGRFGGTISAALFLEQFTLKENWVHFDIAGPSRNPSQTPLCPKGGTGFMVLTALQYLKEF